MGALELRHFQLIVAIADNGSLVAASEQLHLTSSALSHQLRDAEERLRTRLFRRDHRRLILTGAGEALLASARRVLAEVASAEAGLRGDTPTDLLRLSTGCYTVYGWLPPLLARWQAAHPRVDLRIVLEATRRPVAALLEGQLDLALATDPPRDARLTCTPLVRDELVLLVPATHPLARRAHVDAKDLSREHVLTYDAPRDQLDLFTRVLWPAGVEPQRVSRVPLTEALIQLVRGGVGVTALADWVAPRDSADVRAVRLTSRGVRRRWSAVTLKSRPATPALRLLVALLREHLATPVAGTGPTARVSAA